MPGLIPVKAPIDSPPLEREALEKRLLVTIAVSMGQDGKLDANWMVMHIRLIHCDMIRVAHLAARRSAKGKRARFKAIVSAGENLLRSVLRAMLPLFVEFADPLECSIWLLEEAARVSVRDQAFIDAANAAGLPLVAADLDYALVPLNDREEAVFRELTRCARLAMMQ